VYMCIDVIVIWIIAHDLTWHQSDLEVD